MMARKLEESGDKYMHIFIIWHEYRGLLSTIDLSLPPGIPSRAQPSKTKKMF